MPRAWAAVVQPPAVALRGLLLAPEPSRPRGRSKAGTTILEKSEWYSLKSPPEKTGKHTTGRGDKSDPFHCRSRRFYWLQRHAARALSRPRIERPQRAGGSISDIAKPRS